MAEKLNEEKDQVFYFTFGSSEQFPFQGGYVAVIAESLSDAIKKFQSVYPNVNEGILNCSDYYNSQEFSKYLENGSGDTYWNTMHDVLGVDKATEQSLKEIINKAEQYGYDPSVVDKINQQTNAIWAEQKVDYTYEYKLLSRCQQDCEYYLGAGQGANKHLWAGSVAEQIAKMEELYNRFPDGAKPAWINMTDIKNYETKMKEVENSMSKHQYTVSFERNGVLQANVIEANSQQQALDYFKKSKPDAKLYGIKETTRDHLKPGMPIIDAQTEKLSYFDPIKQKNNRGER